MAISIQTMVLASTRMVAPSIRHLVLKPAEGELFDFTPGQFITIHFEMDGTPLRRSYSIASSPEEKDYIEFAASYVAEGPGTDLLFNLKPGDPVNVTGPHGRLILRDEQPKRYLMVATGTGVTPYRAMLPEIARRLKAQPELEVHVFLGVQKPEQLLYGEDFIEFAKHHQNFYFHAYYSREMPGESHSHDNTGYVQHGFEKFDLCPEGDIFYLCGNPNMIDDAFTQLKELGFSPQSVRREKYISAKTPKSAAAKAS